MLRFAYTDGESGGRLLVDDISLAYHDADDFVREDELLRRERRIQLHLKRHERRRLCPPMWAHGLSKSLWSLSFSEPFFPTLSLHDLSFDTTDAATVALRAGPRIDTITVKSLLYDTVCLTKRIVIPGVLLYSRLICKIYPN